MKELSLKTRYTVTTNDFDVGGLYVTPKNKKFVVPNIPVLEPVYNQGNHLIGWCTIGMLKVNDLFVVLEKNSGAVKILTNKGLIGFLLVSDIELEEPKIVKIGN
jgi:hypothetical protein